MASVSIVDVIPKNFAISAKSEKNRNCYLPMEALQFCEQLYKTISQLILNNRKSIDSDKT